MSRHAPSVVGCLVIVFLVPSSADSFELELVPGEPPRPIVLPAGMTPDRVVVETLEVVLETRDPTPQPATRTLYVAGWPVAVTPTVSSQPLVVRSSTISGRQILLVGAARRIAAGQVSRVVARVVARDGGGEAPPPVPAGWRTMLPSPARVLAVVTTERTANRSQSLERYLAWRRAGGWDVVLGTEAEWDHPVGEGRDRRPERIRAWLRAVRDERGLGAVLLIGDPSPRGGDVPMVQTHPLSELVRYYPPELADVLDPVPTDHYYAELDGDWDLDGDGRYAEYPDDAGEGGVSFEADALVGRIPVYGGDIGPLDRMLDAIVAYESEPSPGYRRRVLLPAAFIGIAGSPAPGGGVYEETSDGAVAAQVLHEAIAVLDSEAETLRFFEEAGIVPSVLEHERPLELGSLLSEWTLGAGLVVAFAHGSTQGDYRLAWLEDRNDDGVPDWSELLAEPFLTSQATGHLADAGRAFTFHASCENGWPEDPDNLATSLLRSGAIGAVGASRAAIGSGEDFQPAPELGDADTLAFAYAHLLLEGASAGQAVAYLRYGLAADGWGEESGLPLNGYGWLGKLEYNLYGDPTVGLGRCVSDLECSDSSLCNGRGRCVEGYCVQGRLVECPAPGPDEPCLVARCDPSTGSCAFEARPEGTVCDDGLYCTVGDHCTAGECVGLPRSCGEAPEGFVALCDEARRGCLIEPDGPSGDGGPDDGDRDGPSPWASSRARGGGGCSGAAAPARLPALLRALL